MKKSLLHSMSKNIPRISPILLLIASMTLAGIPRVHAQLPYISLNPTETTVPAPGETFTVDVNITEITDLYGYEFKLAFNTTILNATAVTPGPVNTEAGIFKLLPGEIVDSTYVWVPLRNASDGYVHAGCMFVGTFDGSGILMTINFTALAEGNCTLHLYNTVFGNSIGQEIEHSTLDGTVTVVPEFPVAIVMPLLLITTLAAAFLAKMVRSRKRKDALIVE